MPSWLPMAAIGAKPTWSGFRAPTIRLEVSLPDLQIGWYFAQIQRVQRPDPSMASGYLESLRSTRIGTAMRCIPLATFLLLGLIFVLVAAGAVGSMKAVWTAMAVIFGALSWSFAWRVVRFRASGRYVAALQSGQGSATILRRPHMAISGTMVAVVLLFIAIWTTSTDTSLTVVSVSWFLAISGGAFAAAYRRRSRFPLIISAEGLTDRTVNLDNIAWSRITNCRIWAPKGLSIGIFIEIEPSQGWEPGRKAIGINCLDLTARAQEVLAMFELCSARKLRA